MTASKLVRNPDWPAERVDRLRALWAANYSASEIASQLGENITRSAVIGKVHRLELARRRPSALEANLIAIREESEKKRQVQRQARDRIKRAERIKNHTAKIAEVKAVALPAVRPTPFAGRATAWVALPGSEPVPLLHLQPHTCKWPLGDGYPWMCCGLPTDGTYCPDHSSLSVKAA